MNGGELTETTETP